MAATYHKLSTLEAQVHKNLLIHLKQCTDVFVEESKADPSRVFFLRPSSFPYCGLRRFLDLPDTNLTRRHLEAGGAYYTRVGTVAHTVFQAILGRGKQLIGDWTCPACKAKRKFSFEKLCKCGERMVYEELEVFVNKTVKGHLDGLYFDEKTKTYWIIDYKTTSMRKLWEHNKTKKVFPYGGNVAQIKAYVPLLEATFKIKIAGWILIYLPRDDPMRNRVIVPRETTTKMKTREHKNLERSIKVHRKFLKAKTVDDVMLLQKYRLCESLEDYKENYRDDFNECAHCKYCHDTSAVKAKAKTILKEMTIFPFIDQAPPKIRKELGL